MYFLYGHSWLHSQEKCTCQVTSSAYTHICRLVTLTFHLCTGMIPCERPGAQVYLLRSCTAALCTCCIRTCSAKTQVMQPVRLFYVPQSQHVPLPDPHRALSTH